LLNPAFLIASGEDDTPSADELPIRGGKNTKDMAHREERQADNGSSEDDGDEEE
jgi:hypothetical protein